MLRERRSGVLPIFTFKGKEQLWGYFSLKKGNLEGKTQTLSSEKHPRPGLNGMKSKVRSSSGCTVVPPNSKTAYFLQHSEG